MRQDKDSTAYSDDRLSLAQEIRETLRSRGHWTPSGSKQGEAGPDLIMAVGLALSELHDRTKRLSEAISGLFEDSVVHAPYCAVREGSDCSCWVDRVLAIVSESKGTIDDPR